MDEATDLTIRAALTGQLRQCEARAAKLAAELESVTAAMKQSDAANVALATKLESANRKLADLIAEVRGWTDWSDDSLDALCAKYEVKS